MADNPFAQYVPDTSAPAVASGENPFAQFDASRPKEKKDDSRDSLMGRVDSAVRGLADVLTLGTADEIAAGLGTGFGYLGDYQKELDRQRGIDKSDEENRFGYRLGGQLAGGVAGGAGLARSGLSLAANAARAGQGLGRVAVSSAAEGAALGGLHGAGSGEDPEGRLKGAGLGVAVGGGAGLAAPFAISGISGAARRLVSPLTINAERQAAADVLRRDGVDLTAGQITGRKGLRYAEGEIGGSAADDIMERQGGQFTRAALRRVGEDATHATPEVIDRAFTRIGQQFDDLAARNAMRADTQLGNDLTGAVTDYYSLVSPSHRAPVVEATARDIINAVRANNGSLPGEAYQAMRSRLDRIARTSRNDPQLQDALFGVRNALDDAMERSINPADRAAWQEARQQYRNMLVIEKAATGAGENTAQGLISPSQLRNATVSQNRRAYARGRGDFADLARSGEALMKPMPQSGTAPRLRAQNIGAMIPAILGGGAGAATGAGPLGAMAGAAAGAVLPRMVGAAMMTRPGQAYLTNQLLAGGLSPETRGFLNALVNLESSAASGRLAAP